MKRMMPVIREASNGLRPTPCVVTVAVLVAVDTLTVDRREHTALVVLPSGYDHETRPPVLFGYHGGGGSAAQMQTGLDAIADDFGFAIVYLDACDGFWVTPCPACDYEGRDPLEEIDYAHDLIRSLSRSHALDPDRVYATGFSMGGFFLNHVGCLPDLPFNGTKVQVQKVERIGHWWLAEDNNPSRVDCGRTIVEFFGLDR